MKKKKRLLLGGIMSFIMVLAMMPGMAFAQDSGDNASENVIFIGEQSYASLADAINSITEEGFSVPEGGDVVIEIRGDIDISDIGDDGGVINDDIYRFDLNEVSGLERLTIRGVSDDSEKVKVESGVTCGNIDKAPYTPVVHINLPEGGVLTVDNLHFPNSLMFDAYLPYASNDYRGTTIVENCIFNQCQTGYPQSSTIKYLNNEFRFTDDENLDTDLYYNHNAYPLWFKFGASTEFVFSGNTVEFPRGVHIECRDGSETATNLSLTNNTFNIVDPVDPDFKSENQTAFQLVNKINGRIEFSGNTVNANSAIRLYSNLTMGSSAGIVLDVSENTLMHDTVLIKNETLEGSDILESLGDEATIEEPTVVHEYGDWQYDNEAHWKTCKCGDIADKDAHSFVWIVDKAATATAVGSRHEQCEVCGFARAAVEIPATGAENTDNNVSGTTDGRYQTGDDFNMTVMIAVMFIAAAAAAGTVVYGRRKRNS